MKTLPSLVGAAVAAAVFVVPAFAQDLVFMLDNQSSYDIVEFYASPTNVRSWEEDILGRDVLSSGDALRITIADGRSVCEYDLLVVFHDGDQMEDAAIDLCETGSYTVED
jgi:hypothetical protein